MRHRRLGFEGLSPREREVFALFLEGHRWKEIAVRLGVNDRTVHTHHVRLLRKLGIEHDVDLMKLGIRHGLTTLELASETTLLERAA